MPTQIPTPIPLPSKGAVFRVFPDPWTVWREDAAAAGGYSLVFRGMARPSGDEVDELIYPDDDGNDESGPGLMAGFSKFVKGFQAM